MSPALCGDIVGSRTLRRRGTARTGVAGFCEAMTDEYSLSESTVSSSASFPLRSRGFFVGRGSLISGEKESSPLRGRAKRLTDLLLPALRRIFDLIAADGFPTTLAGSSTGTLDGIIPRLL